MPPPFRSRCDFAGRNSMPKCLGFSGQRTLSVAAHEEWPDFWGARNMCVCAPSIADLRLCVRSGVVGKGFPAAFAKFGGPDSAHVQARGVERMEGFVQRDWTKHSAETKSMDYQALSFEATSASTGEIYTITVERRGNNLTCACTCPAGSKGTHCKHRIGVLAGDRAAVSGGDVDRLGEVAAMLAGTDVERALEALIAAEARKSDADRELKAAKKALARTMDD